MIHNDDKTMWFQTHTHTHTFNGPLSGTIRVSRYQKGKTNLDFTEARDSEWRWHQLGHMQVCISLQTDNHASTPPLSFLQAGCPSCRPTNSVKALKALWFQSSDQIKWVSLGLSRMFLNKTPESCTHRDDLEAPVDRQRLSTTFRLLALYVNKLSKSVTPICSSMQQ